MLSALQQLLKHPNPASPLNSSCAEQMKSAYKLYVQKAKQMTLEHAGIEGADQLMRLPMERLGTRGVRHDVLYSKWVCT